MTPKAQPQSGLSRRGFMVVAGGSAAAAFLAACGSDSDASGETSEFGDGDIGILNYAITLEYLEAAFYADAVASGLFSGSVKEELAHFGEQEKEHIDSLTKAVERLGGDPAPEPQTKLSFDTESDALALANELEDLGAAAYLGQLTKVEDKSALKTILSIHTVEGRHAAAIADFRGVPFTPDGPFARPASATAVLKAVEPYLAEPAA